MTQSLRVLCCLVVLTSATFSFKLSAQTFIGIPQIVDHPTLKKVLNHWEVYQIDVAALNAKVKTKPGSNAIVDLQLGMHQWNLNLVLSGVVASNYQLQVQSEKGIQKYYVTSQNAFKGTEINGNGNVRLTIDEDFLYGYVQEGAKRYYIEPLYYYDRSAARDMFVVYDMDDVNRDNDATCAVIDENQELQKILDDVANEKKENGAESLACYQLELAIASDASMFSKYGSVSGVENHNIGVLNDVQGDYIGSFNHDITFVVVTQFVSTGSDPWTTSLDAGALLSSFRTWGQAGNFGVPFDLGELWTNRDFTGGTVGIAYLGAVCTSFKYHCLQDFTSNSELLRCMTSHEIGHNFSMNHDGAGACPPNYIMCPFVSTANIWSSGSQSSFNSYVGPLINNGCITACGPTATPNFTWNPNPACQGQTVQFTDQSTGSVTSRTWTFQNGTPSTSSQQNPVVTWSTSGTFNVTLTVNGNASITQQIVVQPLPTANFTFTVSGLTVNFTNTSTNATGYIWDFGDGNSSFDVNPIHTYADAGTYVVTLSASNNCSTKTITKTVNTAPTAGFSASPTTGCATLFVSFTNESSSNATAFQWLFPGGNPSSSSLANPIVFYNTAGTYNVTLTAINASGNAVETKTSYIQVKTTPIPGFNFSSNGLVVTFTNTSSNATSYSWNFGDNTTSTLPNPVHTYAIGGTYTVVLTATNDCGTTTVSKTVTLALPPVTAFTAAPTLGCAPLTVQFTNQTTGALSYNWSFPGGTPATSTAVNPSVVFANSGTYTVTLTSTNAGGTSTATQTITVNEGPNAGFNLLANGATVNFTNTSSFSNTYQWNFGDNTTSTDTDPVHTYTTDGVYIVRLIATGACGIDTFFETITIVTPPIANFTGTPTGGCAPLTVQFNSTGTANATNYQWQFQGGTTSNAGIANPVVVYATAGSYSVTLTVSNAAGSNSISKTSYITVGTVPATNFSSSVNNSTATFTNSSSNANSYSWNFGDGNNSTASNPTHTYANDGVYTVVLTSTNACGTSTATKVVTIATPPTANFTGIPTSGCAPLTVQFTSTSSANTTNYNWSFPGGVPSTSTLPNPSVVYATPGNFSATLIAGNGAGSNTLVKTDYVSVGAGPTASFAAAINGASVNFSNSSNNANSQNWNFGDGGSSTASNPSHLYTNDGVYTVVLTTTNACGTSTSSQTITIVTLPTAGFTTNITSGCTGMSVQYTSTASANSNTFNWAFPGGTPATSTQQNPIVVYNTPGVYAATLTVGNAAGTATATQNNLITVGAIPNSNFNTTVTGSLATFNNTSSNALIYSWNFGDGTSISDPNPTHIYLSDGVYTVVLTSSNGCGSTTATETITILTAPSAGFIVSSAIGCAPFTVQFTNQSSANTSTYNWSFPGGTPSNSVEENPKVVWDQAGTYTVSLTVSNGAGSSTTSTNITVGTQPAPSFSFLTSGTTVTLTNNSTNANSFNWEFGNGEVSNATNPVYTYPNPGDYDITLHASNACGTVSFVQPVSIAGAAPVAGFETGESSGCVPFTIAFADTSSGNPSAWNWTFQGGNPPSSNLQNPSVSYSAPGSYGVILTVVNQFGSNTITLPNYIQTQGLPAASFTFVTNQGVVSFNNFSFNANSYNWNFGDGSTSNLENPTHTYAVSGTYTVELSSVNGCGASTLQQVVNVVVTGTQTPNWLDVFRVFPNPNNGTFSVEMKGAASDEVEFTLYNTLGSLIKREIVDYSTGNLLHAFQYGDLPAGMYNLRVRSGAQTAYIQIAIQ